MMTPSASSRRTTTALEPRSRTAGMSKRRRPQADQKADLRGGRFIGLPTAVFKSVAWRQGLSSFDRDVHLQILAEFNGYNNGKIVISQRQIAGAMGNSNFGKIGRSIARQIEVGLLGISTESVWKRRKAREYRLTYCSTSQPPFIIPATNEYLHWQKNDADDVSAGKAPSADDVSASQKSAADDVSAKIARNRQKCVTDPKSAADDVSSLISKPYQGGSKSNGSKAPKQRVADFGGVNAGSEAGVC